MMLLPGCDSLQIIDPRGGVLIAAIVKSGVSLLDSCLLAGLLAL